MTRTITYLIVSIILLGGCVSKDAPMKTYILNPNLSIKRVYSSYKNNSVKIAYPINIKGKSTTALYFSYSDIEEGVYQNASWSSSSSQLLTGAIIRSLEKGKIFKSVVDYNSQANTDYILESEIYDMYHKIRDKLSIAVVTIRFDLVNTQDNALIKSKKFCYEIATETTDAQGYVKATNSAIEQLSRDLVKWVAR